MASAQDVLDAINNNTTVVRQKLDTLNASVNALDADVKLVQQLLLWGFEQLITLGQYTNQALFQNDNQNDTIICSLQQIAVNTCGIWNEADVQTELQKRTVSAAQKLAQLYAASHGDAAIALHRNAELLRRIEECCPCEPPKPVCDESPCPARPTLTSSLRRPNRRRRSDRSSQSCNPARPGPEQTLGRRPPGAGKACSSADLQLAPLAPQFGRQLDHVASRLHFSIQTEGSILVWTLPSCGRCKHHSKIATNRNRRPRSSPYGRKAPWILRKSSARSKRGAP